MFFVETIGDTGQRAGELTEFPWYAVRTRSNQERMALLALAGKGYQPLLPAYRVKRRWSDRIVETEFPVFPGYLFCRFDAKKRTPILSSAGVSSIIGFGGEPAPIPDHEIEAIERVMQSGLTSGPCAFTREGERVRLTRGPLENLEGIVLKKKSDWRLVVSVPMLQRSVSVEIDADWVADAKSDCAFKA